MPTETANLVKGGASLGKTRPGTPGSLDETIVNLENHSSKLAACVGRLDFANGILFGLSDEKPRGDPQPPLAGSMAGRLAEVERTIFVNLNDFEEKVEALITALGR